LRLHGTMMLNPVHDLAQNDVSSGPTVRLGPLKCAHKIIRYPYLSRQSIQSVLAKAA